LGGLLFCCRDDDDDVEAMDDVVVALRDRRLVEEWFWSWGVVLFPSSVRAL